jgi:DNA-directed RNA polymerase subunit RPC12/RpoP
MTASHERTGAATPQAAGPLGDVLAAALERVRDRDSKVVEFARAIPSPYAACPSCGHDMIATSVTPTFLRAGCADINYTCMKCHAQIQRTVKSN